VTDLNTRANGAATGTRDRSRPRTAPPALCATLVLGFLLAQNATSAARYHEDPTYTDAHAETADLSRHQREPSRS
jgi:hypothetical protein